MGERQQVWLGCQLVLRVKREWRCCTPTTCVHPPPALTHHPRSALPHRAGKLAQRHEWAGAVPNAAEARLALRRALPVLLDMRRRAVSEEDVRRCQAAAWAGCLAAWLCGAAAGPGELGTLGRHAPPVQRPNCLCPVPRPLPTLAGWRAQPRRQRL